jgi:hypothetical protein
MIEHDFDAEDISSVKYQQFPVHEVHKIAILGIQFGASEFLGGGEREFCFLFFVFCFLFFVFCFLFFVFCFLFFVVR